MPEYASWGPAVPKDYVTPSPGSGLHDEDCPLDRESLMEQARSELGWYSGYKLAEVAAELDLACECPQWNED